MCFSIKKCIVHIGNWCIEMHWEMIISFSSFLEGLFDDLALYIRSRKVRRHYRKARQKYRRHFTILQKKTSIIFSATNVYMCTLAYIYLLAQDTVKTNYYFYPLL